LQGILPAIARACLIAGGGGATFPDMIRTIRKFGRAALVALAMLSPAAGFAQEADRADLARIQDYLNSIKSLEARFIQVAPDGSVAEGRVLMRRPGRMRFEYDPPTPILMVADGTWFIFHDKQLKQTSHVPLGSTPLAILVQETIELDKSARIERLERTPGALRLTLSDPKKPKDGRIVLVFADQPLALKQWVVQDANGNQTTVALSQMQANIPLKTDLFYFVDMSPR